MAASETPGNVLNKKQAAQNPRLGDSTLPILLGELYHIFCLTPI